MPEHLLHSDFAFVSKWVSTYIKTTKMHNWNKERYKIDISSCAPTKPWFLHIPQCHSSFLVNWLNPDDTIKVSKKSSLQSYNDVKQH